MPNEFLTFFAELFNTEKCLIRDTQRNLGFADGSDEKDDDNNIKQSKSEQSKIFKIKSLFQIKYYSLHYGRQSTPLFYYKRPCN